MKRLNDHDSEARWKRLGDMLMDGGLITRGQLDEGLAEKERQKCFLGQALVKLGYVSQDELISFLVKQCKIPHINLVDYNVEPRIAHLLPAVLCRHYKLIPIDKLGSILTIAMVNPLDIDALEHARAECPTLNLKPILCTPEHFDIVANRLLGSEGGAPEKPVDVTVSLSSFGLAAGRPIGKLVPRPTPASMPKTLPAGTVAGMAGAADFSVLVREILGEILSIFPGAIQGPADLSGSAHSGEFDRGLQFSFTLNVAGDVCYVADVVHDVLGFSPSEFQVRFLELLTNHPGNSVLLRAIALARAGQHQVPVEAEFQASDGQFRMLLVALIPVFDGAQGIVAIQGVARDITRREHAEQQLYLAATQDTLTGLFNRRSFLTRLEETVALARRHQTAVCVCIVNIDEFTRLNQEQGHGFGDQVLIQMGQMLRATLRGEDSIARPGGDEFWLLMPHVSLESARHGIERVMASLAALPVATESAPTKTVTVTAGLVVLGEADTDVTAFVERARALVVQGKRDGGNCIVT